MDILQPIFEFANFVVFQRRLGRSWRKGYLGHVASALFLISMTLFAWGALQRLLMNDMAGVTVNAAILFLVVTLLMEAALLYWNWNLRLLSTPGPDPSWMIPALPIALWVAVASYRDAELGVPISLLFSIAAVLATAGWARITRES